jgi:hypothetical protein
MSWYSSILPLAFLLAWPGAAATQSYRFGQPVTLPAGTPMTVRLGRALSTEYDRAGSQFTATLADPIVVNGNLVLARGTRCYGTVVASKKSGHLKGRAEMVLRLDSIQAYGRSYPVVTVGPNFTGQGKKAHNWKWIGGGSAGGSLIGAIAGGGAGALIGAGVGAAGGAAGAAASSNRNLTLAAETPLTFNLARPVTLHKPLKQ